MTCLSLLTPYIFPFLCDLCVMCVCVVRVFGGSEGDGGWLFLVPLECLAKDLCHHVSNGISKEHMVLSVERMLTTRRR